MVIVYRFISFVVHAIMLLLQGKANQFILNHKELNWYCQFFIFPFCALYFYKYIISRFLIIWCASNLNCLQVVMLFFFVIQNTWKLNRLQLDLTFYQNLYRKNFKINELFCGQSPAFFNISKSLVCNRLLNLHWKTNLCVPVLKLLFYFF